MSDDPEPLIAELRAIEDALPAGPWEVWTSCSFRRVTGPDGKAGGVLSAYNQRSDNHPDLSMPEGQLKAWVALRNALPDLLTALEAARRRVGVLEGEAGLIAIDRAFIDGAKAGYRFGVTEDMDGLEAFLAIRRSEISATLRGPDHAD